MSDIEPMRNLPEKMREDIMLGGLLVEAVRLELDTASLRRVAGRLLEAAEHPQACLLFGIRTGCGKNSVHVLNGGQWFCRVCSRYWYGSGAKADAEGHG
jgi:hypothetical protein